MSNQSILHGVSPSELREVYKAAVARGASLRLSRSTHVIVDLPAGGSVHGPFTAGSGRAAVNLRSKLRRAGLAL